MALLDRFRTPPRQAHPDPGARLAFVQEVPLGERDLIAEIARDDEDARVRRAAVAKLTDPDVLAEIALTDTDGSVRDQARAMLRDVALDAFEGVAEAESLAAVDALASLGEVKSLALVAKTALREEVARRALVAVTDQRALGLIARHASLDPIRIAALDALHDVAEIVAVAMNGAFKDTAVAAVERVADRADLEQIAARGKNKSAAKRARGMLRDLDERAAAGRAAAAPPLEQVVPSLVDVAADAAADAARFEEEDQAARAEVEREQMAAEALRRAEEARAEAAAAAEAERTRREEEAADHRRREAERRQGRLTELLQEAESASADTDLAAARRRLTIVGREWRDLTSGLPIDAEVAERYRSVAARLAVRESEAREQQARGRREALERLERLLARVEPLLVNAELTLQAGERALGEVHAALSEMPPLPSKADYEEIARRLKNAQAVLTPRVQELRDFAGWQRWANVGIQEQLCEQMEALRAAEDPEKIARQVHELQQQWKQAADVPRPQREALWQRFKTAHDEAWARVEAHLAAQAQAREANLAKKVALCERVEALADSTDWIRTAEEIKRLQGEWKTIGAAVRGQEKALWERFRVACDRFFTRRQADLADRKKIWAANLAKKEALCAAVEALAESTDWEATAAEIRRLQAEWKGIGPVKKTRSEAIWQRFRTACDHFFTRYARRYDIAREERVAAREAICAELEALARPAEVPPDLLATVQALRARWQREIAARGVDRDCAMALDRRFSAAFAAVVARWPAVFAGGDFDLSANQKKMETLARRMDELAISLGRVAGATAASGAEAALSPATRLAAMLKEALAANTIGGKVDEGAKWRAAAEEVRRARASWARIGPVPEEARRTLTDRFERACRWMAEKSPKL